MLHTMCAHDGSSLLCLGPGREASTRRIFGRRKKYLDSGLTFLDGGQVGVIALHDRAERMRGFREHFQNLGLAPQVTLTHPPEHPGTS